MFEDKSPVRRLSTLPQRLASIPKRVASIFEAKPSVKQLKDNPDIAYVRKHLLRMDTEEAMELKRDIVRKENVLVDTLKEEVSAKTYKLVKLKSAVDAVIAAQMPKAFGDLIDASIDLVRALEELEEMKHLEDF